MVGKYVAGTLRACVLVIAAACAGGCATNVDDDIPWMIVPPSRSTTEAEITAAIQDLISTYPVCIRIPLFKTVDTRPVDLDPAELGLEDEDAEIAFDVMVRFGYMTRTPRPDLGSRFFEFKRTPLATDPAIVKSGGFCMPARRKLERITNIDRQETEADSSYWIVDFVHAQDPESVWAKNPDLRQLAAGEHGSVASRPLNGRVLLQRVWLRDRHPLEGAPESGELWAPSYDHIHNRWNDIHWGHVNLRPWGSN
jgi:hypothetical protein